MKKLLWLLLFLPGTALGQDKKLIKHLTTAIFYVKLEKPNGISVCGEESVNFYVSNKRIYIDTYNQHFDLKVVKRKAHWLAKDKEDNYYYIFGTNFEGNTAIIIDPYDVNKPVFIFSTANLCER
jgi:hypothetical protein